MAVLLDMKARVGYPEWDEDIPEGYDQMVVMSHSQQGQLCLETVLARNLMPLLLDWTDESGDCITFPAVAK